MLIIMPLEAQWWNPMSWDQAPLAMVIGALWLISILRSATTYSVGRLIARQTGHSRWNSLLNSKHYLRAQSWLNKWGPIAVASSFLTVGLLTMINLSAGITRMKLIRYLVAVALGSVVWATVYGTVGFVGLIAFEKLWEFSPGLAITLIALIASFVCYHLWNVLLRHNVEPNKG